MLVLSRYMDESLVIDIRKLRAILDAIPEDALVEIIVVDIRGDKVRIGINAPKVLPVHRREVFDAIEREKNEALAQ